MVVVTSPRPGEGKSSVAANLAAASALAGKRVILVDGDLRKPQVHRLFRLPDSVGLSTLLRGEIKISEVVKRLVGLEHLLVVPAGPPPPDPAELLTNVRLDAMFAVFGRQADLVVVDAPPLLAVTDPTIIARHCDGVLMVATAGQSTKAEWIEALARLAVVDATVLGTVLLEPDARIQAVPIYRYTPSAVPENWWVTPTSARRRRTGPHRPPRRARHRRRRSLGADPDPDADVSDGWPRRPAGG